MESTGRDNIWVSVSTCSYIIEAGGTIMGHHGTPLSAGAAPRGSHFVLAFHFQRLRRPLTFMPPERVSHASSDQPTLIENACTKIKKKIRICVDSARYSAIMHSWIAMQPLRFVPLWILLLLSQGGCASGESNACLKLHHRRKKKRRQL